LAQSNAVCGLVRARWTRLAQHNGGIKSLAFQGLPITWHRNDCVYSRAFLDVSPPEDANVKLSVISIGIYDEIRIKIVPRMSDCCRLQSAFHDPTTRDRKAIKDRHSM
jgi:hypothetical protein